MPLIPSRVPSRATTIGLWLAAAGLALGLAAAVAAPPACLAGGQWAIPGAAPAPTSLEAQVAAVRDRQVVLLGETHVDAAHHRWQLDALRALHGARPRMVVGFEMFPRRVQGALDRWVRGETDEETFLRESDWDRVWRYDPQMYLPLFRYAREHRIPMLALNVEQELTRDVGRSGWAGVPVARREGVGEPAPASAGYRSRLREVYARHEARPQRQGAASDEADFENFAQAQLLWDRAMAEPLARAAQGREAPLVVGVMGNGHIESGHGVPHQLRALGVSRIAAWMPLPDATACADLPAGLADSVVALKPELGGKPRLGVLMEPVADGVRVREVVAGSVAERAGLRSGDVIVAAAGDRVAVPEDLVRAIRRHGPGTRLALAVQRQAEKLEVVAVFPSEKE